MEGHEENQSGQMSTLHNSKDYFKENQQTPNKKRIQKMNAKVNESKITMMDNHNQNIYSKGESNLCQQFLIQKCEKAEQINLQLAYELEAIMERERNYIAQIEFLKEQLNDVVCILENKMLVEQKQQEVAAGSVRATSKIKERNEQVPLINDEQDPLDISIYFSFQNQMKNNSQEFNEYESKQRQSDYSKESELHQNIKEQEVEPANQQKIRNKSALQAQIEKENQEKQYLLLKREELIQLSEIRQQLEEQTHIILQSDQSKTKESQTQYKFSPLSSDHSIVLEKQVKRQGTNDGISSPHCKNIQKNTNLNQNDSILAHSCESPQRARKQMNGFPTTADTLKNLSENNSQIMMMPEDNRKQIFSQSQSKQNTFSNQTTVSQNKSDIFVPPHQISSSEFNPSVQVAVKSLVSQLTEVMKRKEQALPPLNKEKKMLKDGKKLDDIFKMKMQQLSQALDQQ